jgi:16S rRNA G966 N2-methylase RsmD
MEYINRSTNTKWQKHIKLKTSKKIKFLLDGEYFENLRKYVKENIIYRFLANEYELLTFSMNAQLQKGMSTPEARNLLKLNNLNEPTNLENVNFKSVNDVIHLDNYTIYPISKTYNYQILSPNMFDYYDVLPNIDEGSTSVVIQTLGPWEIKDKILTLTFELEDMLVYKKNCKVYTIFLLFHFSGKKSEYISVHETNQNKTEYMIFDMGNMDNKYKLDLFLENKNIHNIYLNTIQIDPIRFCQSQVTSIPTYLLILNKLLMRLELNGNLYIKNNEINLSKPFIQLLYLLSKMFHSLRLLPSVLTKKFGIYVFKTYKFSINNAFNKIIEPYETEDKYMGQNTLIDSKKETFCSSYPKALEGAENTRKDMIDICIKSIYSKRVSSRFIDFIQKTYIGHKKVYDDLLLKINYMRQQKKLDIHSILANNISKCISYCEEHDIQINQVYKDFKVLNHIDVVKSYFDINTKNVKPEDIQIAIDSIFSITRPSTTKRMSELIKLHFPSVTTIIDGNANVGSTSIVFSEHFANIISVEFSEVTYKMLQHNVNVYGLKNIKVLHDDITIYMKNRQHYDPNTYCLFLDPPWTGVFYQIDINLDLFLSNINILDFIKNIGIKYICIKVPKNYNFNNLYKYFFNTVVYRLQGFYFVLITNNRRN